MTSPSFSTQTATNKTIVVGGNIHYREQTLLNGQNLGEGSVLGKVTASGKLVLSLAAAGDGSEVPYAILTTDQHADGADLQIYPLMSGDVDETELVFGTGHTAATVYDALRERGIFLLTASESDV